MGDRQFAGATQLLSSSGTSSEEATEAAKTMAAAVDDLLPESGQANLQLKDGTFKWKEFRTPTKLFLSGLANSLQQVMPDDFTLKSCCPLEPLLPCGPDGSRHELNEAEMMVQAVPADAGRRFFCFDANTSEARRDFYSASSDFYHLVLTADEGTEAQLLKSPNTKKTLPCSVYPTPGLPRIPAPNCTRHMDCLLGGPFPQSSTQVHSGNPSHHWWRRLHAQDAKTVPAHSRSVQD